MTNRHHSNEGGPPNRRLALRLPRYLLWAIVAVTLAAPVVGYASTLPSFVPEKLAAGVATIGRCDTNGFSVTYTTSGGNVTVATISGIDAACAGGQIQATLMNGGTRLATSGETTVAGASANVSFASPPDGELVTGIHILVNGP